MKTILALLALCLCVSCRQQDAPATSLNIAVSADYANDDNSQLTFVSFRPPGKAEIIVDSAGNSGTIVFDPKNPNSGQDSTVRLSAKRQKADSSGTSSVETIIRPETPNGGYAGGSTIQELPASTPLYELLAVTIQDGDYPLGVPIEIGTYKGSPVRLTVRSVP